MFRQSWKDVNVCKTSARLINPMHVHSQALMNILKAWLEKPNQIRQIAEGEDRQE
jgi:hypothetical protein